MDERDTEYTQRAGEREKETNPGTDERHKIVKMSSVSYE